MENGPLQNITVHYTEKLQVSGRRVLMPLRRINGLGHGLRHSAHLILPIYPIIAQKNCGSGYELLNIEDTRITLELAGFNGATELECLLVKDNIELIREATGTIYPHIGTRVPTRDFLDRLKSSKSLTQILSSVFPCVSSHSRPKFSTAKLAEMLGPNGPSKATITRILQPQKTELSDIKRSSNSHPPTPVNQTAETKTGESLSRPSNPEKRKRPSIEAQKAAEKWIEVFHRNARDFEKIKMELENLEARSSETRQICLTFFNRVINSKTNDELEQHLEKVRTFIQNPDGV